MSDPLKDVSVTSKADANPLVGYWKKEINLSLQRVKKFREHADEVVKIYEVDDQKENNFNILYANTETLLPAIYNSSPRPVVERRFHDPDPLAKCASDTLERTLSYLLDTNSDEYERYHGLFRQAVLMALVPGQGVTWWKYDPKISEAPPAGKTESGEPDAEVTGAVLPQAGGKVLWETICGEDVNYDEFLHGWARRWLNVPWVARKHGMTKEDCTKNFGEELAGKLSYTTGAKKDSIGMGNSSKDDAEEQAANQGSTETCEVYEIWNKPKKEVVFFAPSYPDGLLKTVDDPLKLPGFFPCYRPLHFLKKTSTLIPTPVYMAYRVQARLLNNITMRITRVTNALKVRGFYDGTIQGLKELLSKDDNTLIAAKNTASFQGGQTLANSIWLMPLNDLVNVLNELYGAQEKCKNTIYELTGIADIMRGDTQASETATAQNIKNKWGTLRLQNMQGAVQDYVRGNLRIVATLAGKHFGVETFAAMTSLDYATPEQVQQAEQMQKAVQQQLLLLQQQQAQLPPPAPAPAMPGGPPSAPPAPPQPPPIPPALQQAQQQVQETLSKPKWEDVVQLLRDDLERQYRIDIETNSTLADTSQEDQQNITNAMTAVGNTMQTFGPYVEQGVFPMPAFKSMLLAIARRFEFGREVEQQLQAIPDQVPQTPNNTPPASGPSPQELAAQQAQADHDAQINQLKLAKAQRDDQLDQMQNNFAQQELQRKGELAQATHQFKLGDIAMKTQQGQAKTEGETAEAKAAITGASLSIAVGTANLHKAQTAARQQAEKPKPKGPA